jgi:acylphosphatase
MSRVLAERREVHYDGRVQGVGFRYTVRHIASRYPVTGFVENLPDGRVHLIAEGDRDNLEEFLHDIKAAMSANIGRQLVDKLAASGEFTGFEIRL